MEQRTTGGFDDWAKGKPEKYFSPELLSCSAEGSDELLASSLLQSVLSLGEKVLIDLRLVCATASCCCFINSGFVWSFILQVFCVKVKSNYCAIIAHKPSVYLLCPVLGSVL